MIAVTSLGKACWLIWLFQQQTNVETVARDLATDASNIEEGFAHYTKLF